MTDFEKFIHERGYKYTTDEAIKAAYDRAWKCKHGVALTEEEFIAEVEPDNDQRREAVKETYAALVNMVEQKKLEPAAIYRYAYYRWCLRNASAIVAYEREKGKWEVNNCDREITTERAIVEINREWGFEASRIKVIGTPYYDATDWMFIRFDCAHIDMLTVR